MVLSTQGVMAKSQGKVREDQASVSCVAFGDSPPITHCRDRWMGDEQVCKGTACWARTKGPSFLAPRIRAASPCGRALLGIRPVQQGHRTSPSCVGEVTAIARGWWLDRTDCFRCRLSGYIPTEYKVLICRLVY